MSIFGKALGKAFGASGHDADDGEPFDTTEFPDLAELDLPAARQQKLKIAARIMALSEQAAAKEIFLRALTPFPNRYWPHYLLPDLKIQSCERIGEDLFQLTLEGGRTFFGQRSNQKEYGLYLLLANRLPNIVTGDAYKLALDVQHRYFETKVPWIGADGGVMIEGGCFTGMKAIRWHDLARGPTRIIAVEMGKTNHDILRTNIEANKLEGSITPVHAGLWSESGEGVQKHSFSTRRFLETSDRWERHMQHEEKVRLVTLDDLIEEQNLDVVDFVNIQVNGAEVEVLKGFDRARDRVKVISVAACYSKDEVKNADVVREQFEAMGCTVLRQSKSGRIDAVTPRFRDDVMARWAKIGGSAR